MSKSQIDNVAMALITEFGDVLTGSRGWIAPETEKGSGQLAAFRSAIKEQSTVVGALVLRDMRTRFGRTHFGFLLAIIWPLSHLGFIMLGYSLANRVAPIGNSSIMFVATGALPYILFFYPARLMMISAFIARPLLHFPVVKFVDIIYARIFLEIVSATAVLIIFSVVLTLLGVDVMPLHPENVAIGIAVTIYLGISFGAYNMVITIVFKPWNVITVISMIGLYAVSGAFVVPTILSAHTRYLMSFNPLYQSVALLRSGYYDGFYDENINPWYVVALGTIWMISAFLNERMLRGRILET